jgi:hypothetical protein
MAVRVTGTGASSKLRSPIRSIAAPRNIGMQ